MQWVGPQPSKRWKTLVQEQGFKRERNKQKYQPIVGEGHIRAMGWRKERDSYICESAYISSTSLSKTGSFVVCFLYPELNWPDIFNSLSMMYLYNQSRRMPSNSRRALFKNSTPLRLVGHTKGPSIRAFFLTQLAQIRWFSDVTRSLKAFSYSAAVNYHSNYVLFQIHDLLIQFYDQHKRDEEEEEEDIKEQGPNPPSLTCPMHLMGTHSSYNRFLYLNQM